MQVLLTVNRFLNKQKTFNCKANYKNCRNYTFAMCDVSDVTFYLRYVTFGSKMS